MCNEYIDVVAGAMWKLPPQAIVGSGLPYMVGRICYTFGFTGEQHFADCWCNTCNELHSAACPFKPQALCCLCCRTVH